MSKYKKMAMLMCSIGLFLLLTGITYSFFNYTRTGSLNNLGTGRITFNSEQRGTFNITNAFPIKSSELENVDLDEITIEIEGDTTYSNGEEFEVKIVEVSNNVSGKRLPITYIATYEAKENKTIGLPSDDYWNAREEKDSNIYLLNETGEVKGNKQILVGYIKNDNNGISGVLTIKAYIDGDKIAISDTYGNHEYIVNENMSSEALSYCLNYFSYATEDYCRGTEKIYGSSLQDDIDNNELELEGLEDLRTHGVLIKPNYTNDTTYEWVDERVVFTTKEWNSFTVGGNPVSFKIRVESNEGIWAKEEETPSSCFSAFISPTYIRNDNMNVNTCVSILTNKGFNNDLLEGETLEAFCSGTGTLNGNDFDYYLKINTFEFITDQLEENEIIIKTGNNARIYDYDESCSEDVVIPRKLTFVDKKYSVNPNMNVNDCINIFTSWRYDEFLQTGETIENFCNGTGTFEGMTFHDFANNNYFYADEVETLVNANILLETINENGEGIVIEISGGRDYPGLGNKGLKSVVIPNTVTYIGNSAFSGNSLTSVNIPNSVTTIGSNAFANNQLSAITIPNSVTSIGASAFDNNQIGSVVIPNSVTTIGSNAFEDNPNLTRLTINMSEIEGSSAGAYSCNRSFAKVIGIDNLTSVTLGNDVRNIANCAFFDDGLESIIIPSGVTGIGNLAFAQNQLTSITIPSGVTTIGFEAFMDNQLESITIPSGVTVIYDGAFENNRLSSVTLEEGLLSISPGAFRSNQLTAITIPNSVTSISTSAFANNNITSLTLGSGITRWQSMASNWIDYQNIQYLDKVTIDSMLFSKITFNTLTLGQNVTTIGYKAFTGANITSITIPATVSSIGSFAFEKTDSSSIGSIIINRTCTDIRAMDNYPWIGNIYRSGTTIYGLNNEVCDSW